VESKTTEHGRLPALTGVRALAALSRLLPPPSDEASRGGFASAWWELHIGVTLFFVLSGS
jgi:peptidoglycan/LPS O-acetylase OafA/YrhL